MLKFLFGVLLVGAGFVLTIFRDPVWGLYLFAATSHIRMAQLGENIPLPLRIPIIIACLALFVYMISSKYSKKFIKWPAEVWLLGLMFLGMTISSSTAHFDPQLSWKYAFDYFKYWIFLVMFIQMIDSIEKVEWFHRVLILSSAWLVYRCWDLRGTTGARFENIGGDYVQDANNFAAALVLLFPFVFLKTLSRDWRVAVAAVTICFGSIMAILISVSRGGFLGLCAMVLFIVMTFRAQRKRIIVGAFAICLAVLPFVNTYQVERLMTVLDADSSEKTGHGDYDSAHSRLEFWKLALRLFVEHPLTGIGLDNFRYYSGYMVEGKPYGTAGHVTHSLWFEMLSGGGLMVFAPFVFMVLRFFRDSGRLARRYLAADKPDLAAYVQAPRIALGAFLVSATFLDRAVYEPMYWCIGLGVAHRYISNDMQIATGTEQLPGRQNL